MAPGEHWTVLGGVGSGKSLLSRLLTGESAPDAGQLQGLPERAIWLSLEQQQDLYERELSRDETDLTDIPDQGTPVRELLTEINTDPAAVAATAELLGLTRLLDRGYRLLSSGEGRRVMLGRALLAKPDLLLLEEPFEGLDAASHVELSAALGELAATGWRLILLVGQRQDIPAWATHIALLDHCRLALTGPAEEVRAHPDWQATTELLQAPAPELPPRQSEFQLPHWPADEPLVHLINGRVAYGDTLQFEGFDWALYPGQHTQIMGPNGCGKSTLLKLVNGDHPQCYVNDLTVFGYRRGRGESIWDIKKHLGYVSTDLQRDYRVSGNVVTAVISGLTDSIGLYQATGQQELDLALQWLDCVGLADKARHSLRSLSSGEQRLVLIARALIKQPPVLILDEPTLGLDDLNRFRVLAVVERLLCDGPTTLLFVSHRQDEQLALIRRRLIFEPASSGWHIRQEAMTEGEA
ncbi:MAG: ATP-binding cassette domain-containing protein [Natronospirillum sp.]|uniref:ATP-binding cassette domain-containing protein n=1 Tax=Natronospirillum sp. TaxID=2812955 RepID=UPI0025D91AAB|nr:ATP-binding cassette domain-containing protein [Natronospirillum sp.]MCH8552611.1 ATP-binding cassette domain-containing protein [Natronospirillum sp.]